MSLKFTILGCGTSTGVPRIGPVWGNCDPDNPKNNRTRCSLLAEKRNGAGTTSILVDTTPDMRLQLLEAKVSWLDGVLYSHEHADHTHGIDDLRSIFFNGRKRVQVYYDKRTGDLLNDRFSYCFRQPEGSNYPAILEGNEIRVGKAFRIDGEGGEVGVLPFEQRHGDVATLGFRIGNVAYSPDVDQIPDESYRALEDLDVWIVDALRYTPHPSHFSLEQALAAIEEVKPRRAILTHMHIDLDYETLRKQVPEGVEPAYDGMVIEVDG